MSGCSATSLKKDETVIFFPVSAHINESGQWEAPIHHWVFEKEEGDITRILPQKVLTKALEGLGVSEEQAESKLTKKRLMWFLVDNQRGKDVNITANKKTYSLNASKANGHAHSKVILNENLQAGDWIKLSAKNDFSYNFSGEVQLIPKTGLSVISDIDDTIKISNVLDKKALIKNTFTKPYQIANGFPEYYKKLKGQGAYFHYVSASPWQLYPSLKSFMAKNYPKGTFSLRNFRLKDSSLFDFLQSSAKYKIKQISNIIKRYPQHQFILIGDSGEHDPEVYAEIYNRYPKKIQSIQIRAVDNSDLSDKRFESTFSDLPRTVWKIIDAPK